MDALQVPPHQLEAELCVVGSGILKPDCLPEVRQLLEASDFYRSANRILFDTLWQMHLSGQEIDAVTVKAHLEKHGLFERIGGIEYFAEVLNVPSAASVMDYAKIVREKAIYRALIAVGLELVKDAYAANDDPADVMLNAQKAIYLLDRRANSNGRQEKELQEAIAAVKAGAEAAQLAHDEGRIVTGRMFTGYRQIDRCITGLRPGHLTTLAAATGAGKTTLALNIAANVAEQGGGVLYISGEMTAEELAQRILQARPGVWGSKILRGDLEVKDWTALHQAEGELENHRVYLCGRAMGLEEIAAKVTEVGQRWRQPVNLVVVDYLQIMRLPKGRDRYERVSEMSTGLKALASELGLTVLMLSQLNRDFARSGQPPQLHQLKESGSIENDSNEVLLLHKPEVNGGPVIVTDTDGRSYIETWLQVSKARDGEITAWPSQGNGRGIRLRWNPKFTLFRDWTDDSLSQHTEI